MTAPDFSDLRRVDTPDGSHFEPPLDQSWDRLTKLRWNAAVVRVRTGVDVRIGPADYAVRFCWIWFKQRGFYDITGYVGDTWAYTTGPFNYADAWTYLNGVESGARLLAAETSEATPSTRTAMIVNLASKITDLTDHLRQERSIRDNDALKGVQPGAIEDEELALRLDRAKGRLQARGFQFRSP